VFLESRCCESSTLRTGVEEIFLYFLFLFFFHAAVVTFGVGGASRNVLH
jgi:hypothetical protein